MEYKMNPPDKPAYKKTKSSLVMSASEGILGFNQRLSATKLGLQKAAAIAKIARDEEQKLVVQKNLGQLDQKPEII